MTSGSIGSNLEYVATAAHHVDTVGSTAFNTGLLVLGVLAVGTQLAYFLWRWAAKGDPIGVFCLLGGVIASTLDAAVDAGGLCWHPNQGQPIAYSIFGHSTPVWALLCYVGFFGAYAYLLLRLLRTSSNRLRLVVIAFVAFAFIEAACEITMIKFGAYYYYGNQPFDLLGFPWYWAAMNACVAVSAGLLLFAYDDRLTGWRVSMSAVVVAASVGVGYYFVGMPTFLMLNYNFSTAWNSLGGAITVVLCVWVLAFFYDLAEGTHQLRTARVDSAEVHV